MKINNIKGGKLTAFIISILPMGLLILAIIIFFKPIKEWFSSIFESVGLKQSQEDKNVVQNIGVIGNSFDPNFYKTSPGGTKLIKQATADNLAKRVSDAITGSLGFTFYVDGNAALAVFQQCPSMAVVSQVSEAFNKRYNSDMLSYMKAPGFFRSGLNSEALNVIINYCNNLPKYT